ncbi:MAG: MotA/TolQ/ExbB proton channel family protein [Gemmataceae bacterium]
MRRFWVHHLLPTLFMLLPLFGLALVFVAIPAEARKDYLARVAVSGIDWLILSLGAFLYTAQSWLGWRALRWHNDNFDSRPDPWLSHLAQAAEWFPLLGLIGTVAAILQTFSSFTPGSNPTPQDIIRKYAPAITATGSGLVMALLNILPTWVVLVGRDLLRTVAGPRPHAMVPLVPAESSLASPPTGPRQ